EKEGAAPAARLAALEAALRYENAWDLHVKIGDVKRRLPNAKGQPDYEGASLAYQRALVAMDRAAPGTVPNAEAEQVAILAGQLRALAPEFVSGRDIISSRTAKTVLVQRVPRPVEFFFDSDEMTEKGRKEADEIFDGLKDEDMPRIRLIGHTDPKGTDDYN